MRTTRVHSARNSLPPWEAASFEQKCWAELRLRDFTATQAGSADADLLTGAFHYGTHGTEIHVPAPLAHIVGMADIVSKLRALTADITHLRHNNSQKISELDAQRIDFTGVAAFLQPFDAELLSAETIGNLSQTD